MSPKMIATISYGGLLAFSVSGVMAATLDVDQHHSGCGAASSPFCAISDAIDNASAGDEILVEPGHYEENVTIDVSVSLVSSGGRSVTVIEGIADASNLGTIQIVPNVDDVQIGDAGKGFTIVGIDNGSPNIQNAAVYFQGDHARARVSGNKIVANGDEGLLTEFGATVSDVEIIQNEFAGTTFFRPPAGEGFRRQFSLPNVPRQLVAMGGGSGGGNTSDITFRDNLITGTTGGVNPGGDEQGNTQVTIDAVGAVIENNRFLGTATRFGTSLRARGSDTQIAGNTFDDSGLSGSACYIFVEDIGARLAQIRARNTFAGRATVEPAPSGTGGLICPAD